MIAIKQIEWQPHENGDLQGMLNSKEVFTIRPTKKGGQFEAISWGMPSSTFRSGSQISLGIFPDVEQAKKVTQIKLDEFVNLFLEEKSEQSNSWDNMTIADQVSHK